mmetsp:Transcript_10936/g.22789  ORF Transcript_10936/g.22789 Transcript_10936/m.22789 type:complete len:411 (-) Transcript_10936:216-1448(-)
MPLCFKHAHEAAHVSISSDVGQFSFMLAGVPSLSLTDASKRMTKTLTVADLTSPSPIVWCHAGLPGTDTGRPDLNEGKVRGGSSLSWHGESATGTRTGKLGSGTVAVETHNAGDGFTTLSITCGDRAGIVHKVAKVLAAADLSIIAATVITKNKVIAIEKFKVVTAKQCKALEEEQHAHLQSLVLNALEAPSITRINSTGEVVGSISVLAFNVLHEPESEESNVELVLRARPGLMKDVTYTLLKFNVNIVHITMHIEESEEGCKSIYNLVLTDSSTGGPLSAKTIEEFEELLKKNVPVYPSINSPTKDVRSPSPAKSEDRDASSPPPHPPAAPKVETKIAPHDVRFTPRRFTHDGVSRRGSCYSEPSHRSQLPSSTHAPRTAGLFARIRKGSWMTFIVGFALGKVCSRRR